VSATGENAFHIGVASASYMYVGVMPWMISMVRITDSWS